jgi:glycerol-3-phosphate acyltransferase PlsY
MNFILTIIISYIIGCFPSALIVSKKIADKNPGQMGSKNYGALNSYEITGSKKVGIIVFLLDALKSVLAVYITWNFIFPKSIYIVLTVIFVVVGHCFNVLLKFKGGRGLSSALGGCLMFNPLILVVWCLIWCIFRIIRKDVVFQNMWACTITPLIVWFAPQYLFYIGNYNYYVALYDYKIYTLILCAVIFIAHIRTHK